VKKMYLHQLEGLRMDLPFAVMLPLVALMTVSLVGLGMMLMAGWGHSTVVDFVMLRRP
jgi:hypothetical protein